MRRLALLAILLLAGASLAAAVQAAGQGLSDDGGAEWRVEQPQPPAPPPGVPGSSTPIGLGRVGDIEFWAPNRGALITAGNGSTIPAGVWLYNGHDWRELAKVCGATDGRIAWAGPDEFWTISDGRPGQAAEALGGEPPLQDNTLCHFAPPPNDPEGPLEVVASYAEPAFQSNSYQVMHAAACLTADDCWFAGQPLPAPQIGAFELHWNGSSIAAEPYLPEGHPVYDISPFEGSLYESLALSPADLVLKRSLELPALLRGGAGAAGFEAEPAPPLYGAREFPYALNYLHLSTDPSPGAPEEEALWGAAGPQIPAPEKSAPAGVTVVRDSKLQYLSAQGVYVKEGVPRWTQVLGPETKPSGLERFPEDVVTSIAAEPGTDSAWLALDGEGDSQSPRPTAHAVMARVSADGTISDELSLPGEGDPYGPKGAVEKLVCPAAHDCWMVTDQGWLLHLSPLGENTLEEDTDPVFAGGLITSRPTDESLPQVPSDAPPADDSGLEEAPPVQTDAGVETTSENHFDTVAVPLLSHVRSRLVHGTTLMLSFHLAVKARVRLLAKRRRDLVASSPMQVLKAGDRSIQLRLHRRRWPTKLELQTHALAPLPTRSTREAGTNTVSTSLAFPNALGTPGLEPSL